MQSYIPHHALIYLLSSLGFILLPHLQRAPVALPIIWLVVSFWQYKFFKQQWQLPAWPIKTLLIVLAVGSIWLQHQSFLSLEFVTQLLLVTLLLKLLEMKSQRDVLILLYLSYFSVVTQLLFSQNITAALYVLVALTAITACLISLHQNLHYSIWSALKLSIKMTAISIPMLIVAFIVFPRLDPFWSVPNTSASAKTGISNSMSPGSFDELLQSNKVALRVVFDGSIPLKQQLYWRTLVLDEFDGKTWRASSEGKHDKYYSTLGKYNSASAHEEVGTSVQYTITQEPTHQVRLFNLNGLQLASRGTYNDYSRTLQTSEAVTERIQYSLSSHTTPALDNLLLWEERQLNTRLPENYNPKTVQFSKNLRRQFQTDSRFIQAILEKINHDNFYYTLTPPRTGKHSVDDFWFSTQRGLCEHYSQALTVILRAADIPARVVTGYQGGFLNFYDNYILVREKDAHAWVEAWVEGRGWQRFDPTSAIHPQRVEASDDNATADDSTSRRSAWAGPQSQLSFLLKAQLRWDQANFFWQQKMLNFDDAAQLKLLENLLGSTDYVRIALFIMLTFFGFIAVFFLIAYFLQASKRKTPISPEQKLYQRFIKQLANQGIEVKINEGCADLSKRLVSMAANDPSAVHFNLDAALLFLKLYINVNYKRRSECSSQYEKNVTAMRHQLQRLSHK